MYAWIRGTEHASCNWRFSPKIAYVLKESGEVCFADFVSSDSEAASFGWPDKICLGEVWDTCLELKHWDKMGDQQRKEWTAGVHGSQKSQE